MYGDNALVKQPEQVDENQKQADMKEHQIFNPYSARAPSDEAAQVRAALFAIPIPLEKDFQEWFPTLRAAIDIVARVPGYDTIIYNELNRDMEDIVDRANSQGRRKIVASKMEKFIFKLRSLVPKGDVPITGVTGVTAMITRNTNQRQVQDIRMPVQSAPTQSLFSGVQQYLNRGK